ncbi:AlpA family transcriptional regulator [Microbacterium sp. RU33B]|uniref:helix-turn-helix transcriptional regulator n=1 Tax=Microbacterium sp. RU33B TaxID=1907390 RepID=UPI0009699DC6|nr:helix-turn-helix domain-containing protein [Microbacterium sp. RU33B]SIT72493.1 transcriptional regulator, AlpA family [Microbacterium sp. RU33B]
MTAKASMTNRPSDPPALLDQHQVAHLLGVSSRTLEDWRMMSQGPSFLKLGYRTVRYELSAIETFIKGARRGTAAA